MKKYIIIILSFLGLLFINVGIVSADGNVSSRLTEAQVKEIKNRIKEAGFPINHRDDLFSKYKGWTDYIIFLSGQDPSTIPNPTIWDEVQLRLYTRYSKDVDGWQLYKGRNYLSLVTEVKAFTGYYLRYDEEKKKWRWYDTNGLSPTTFANGSELFAIGYIFYSTETVPETIDNEFIFFSTEVTSGEEVVEDGGSDQDGGILGILRNIVKSIIGLPGKIIESISNFFKGIFMPDKEVLSAMVNNTKKHIENKFNFLGKSSEVKDVFQSSKSIEDVEATYGNRVIHCYDCEPDVYTPYLGRFEFKVIDSEILNTGLNRFRPVIRGFLVLMLLFYNFNQFLGFIGQKNSVTPGKEEA